MLVRGRDPDEIEHIAHVGSWTLDPGTGAATWSAEMYRILGVDPGGPAIDLADIPTLFTPDSVERIGQAVEHTTRTGEPWLLELEIRRRDGGSGWVVSRGVAERDGTGRVTAIHGTMHDVTEHRALEERLRQSERLEAVGQLAGGIAHDFNNVLTAVRGYTELVRADLEPDDPRAQDLGHVLAATDRAAELVAQLLAFSRRQVLQPRVVDPDDVVSGILPLLRRLLDESIELVTRSDHDVGRIVVDPGQLGQVIVNLAVNARDAMPHGGKLTIETLNVELDADYAALHPDAHPGRHVVVAVTDTGDGMDAETQARAFEPFYTTKGAHGTGMGLATVYGIVKQSGGSIYLYSELGRGTTFKLYFPRTDAEPLTGPQPASVDSGRPQGTETILLVEDDPAVRSYARRVLEAAGYAVLEAADGPAALDIGSTHAGPIDLLLTDAVMPGVHGSELAERLLVSRPDVRVLYVSGFTENTVIRNGVVVPGVAFLPKPYRGQDLIRRVRAVLDRAE